MSISQKSWGAGDAPKHLLSQVGALAVSGQREDENPHDGELTFLGRVLAQLPVNQQLGKLIVLGHIFGCLDECLIIGEVLLQWWPGLGWVGDLITHIFCFFC